MENMLPLGAGCPFSRLLLPPPESGVVKLAADKMVLVRSDPGNSRYRHMTTHLCNHHQNKKQKIY
jgi:hypothetical protein